MRLPTQWFCCREKSVESCRASWFLSFFVGRLDFTPPQHYRRSATLGIRNTQLAVNLMQTTAAESLRLLSYSTNMQRLDVEGRLAYLLLYLAREVFHSKRFHIPINQLKLAELITTSREVVNRIFMAWRRENVIALAQHEVTILQREILEQRCKFCS